MVSRNVKRNFSFWEGGFDVGDFMVDVFVIVFHSQHIQHKHLVSQND